jgi:hypothetical protein
MCSLQCKIYAICVAQSTRCGVPSRGYCGAGDLEELTAGAVPADCSQLQHTHGIQRPVEYYIRETSKTFRKNSFHLHNCLLLNTFPVLSIKNFF